MSRALVHAQSHPLWRLPAIATLLAAGLVAVAPAAQAASHDGDLRLKGPANSAYTQGPYVSQVGTPGTVLTYTVQVVNRGSTVAQFNVKVQSSIQTDVYEGSFALTPLAAGPDGYYTKALAPGGNQVLTVKVRVPSSTTSHDWEADVDLYATDGTFLDAVYLLTMQAAVKGHETFDLYAKSGGQKPVGAPWHDDQVMTAPTITPTGTATFTVTLQNNGVNPRVTHFIIVPAFSCPNLTLTVKDGFTNVTAAALAGTYSTSLNVGASRNLTVAVKASGAGCTWNYFSVSASPPPASFLTVDLLLVNLTG